MILAVKSTEKYFKKKTIKMYVFNTKRDNVCMCSVCNVDVINYWLKVNM